MTGSLVLETGEIFSGEWLGGKESVGEVVFNTSHSGYEEMATDPSYYNQILVLTAPMQGNYGESNTFWESENIWINGFVCLEMQNSTRDKSWLEKLTNKGCPVLSEIDTRKLAITLREKGTVWGAIVEGCGDQALEKAKKMILDKKETDSDWTKEVSCKTPYTLQGVDKLGPKVALIDFGCKKNILRELQARTREVKVFPSNVNSSEIKNYNPDAIFLSNGPGDPSNVLEGTQTVKELVGFKYIYGICMGHQVLAQALGGKTFKLKFGHRGANHPIKDYLTNKVYMSTQNHGYAVDEKTMPKDVEITHLNLNDNVVSGLKSDENKCASVQFHPESHPGPHDAVTIFDYFTEQARKC